MREDCSRTIMRHLHMAAEPGYSEDAVGFRRSERGQDQMKSVPASMG